MFVQKTWWGKKKHECFLTKDALPGELRDWTQLFMWRSWHIVREHHWVCRLWQATEFYRYVVQLWSPTNYLLSQICVTDWNVHALVSQRLNGAAKMHSCINNIRCKLPWCAIFKDKTLQMGDVLLEWQWERMNATCKLAWEMVSTGAR